MNDPMILASAALLSAAADQDARLPALTQRELLSLAVDVVWALALRLKATYAATALSLADSAPDDDAWVELFPETEITRGLVEGFESLAVLFDPQERRN